MIAVARSLYAPAPGAAEAAVYGLTVEEASGAAVEVWPEHMQPLVVFCAMGTQWRLGMGGPTGLDYSALPEVWRRTRTPMADRDEVFECLRVLEEAALKTMHVKRR